MTNEQTERAKQIVQQVQTLCRELQELVEPTQAEWEEAFEIVGELAMDDLAGFDELRTVLEIRQAAEEL
jgi:hypothetical protein